LVSIRIKRVGKWKSQKYGEKKKAQIIYSRQKQKGVFRKREIYEDNTNKRVYHQVWGQNKGPKV